MLNENLKLTHIRASQSKYAKANPFPHVIIDNFFPVEIADRLEKDFPDYQNDFWFRHTDVIRGKARTEKLASNDLSKMPESIREILEYFNSEAFLKILEQMTSIEGLIPDPEYHGGGMHLIRPGGFLEIHADFNVHDKLLLDRRLNLLLYLNKDWKEEYKGHLELWDQSMSRCVQKVLPLFNRCVIFSTTSDSFHGHPEKLTCPPEMSRKSLALYYYTKGRPSSEKRENHSTLYQERPIGVRFKEWISNLMKFKN
jgi:Rps23 Pro-64 3,4-dihydroxylase Tpa1-like proline 4-hydroxylase